MLYALFAAEPALAILFDFDILFINHCRVLFVDFTKGINLRIRAIRFRVKYIDHIVRLFSELLIRRACVTPYYSTILSRFFSLEATD